MALNETLTEGGDIRDGVNITRRMWSRDFHGKIQEFLDKIGMIIKFLIYRKLCKLSNLRLYLLRNFLLRFIYYVNYHLFMFL